MKVGSAIALLLLAANPVLACTTFCLAQNGTVVYGRNYDFDIGTGVVVVNARGVQKTSLDKPGSPLTAWVSLYGSITFNQFGREYPMDGMNEAGLVIGLMWLDGSAYPADDQRPALGVLEWIQYQLDRYGSVAEVLAHAEEVRIRGGTPIHYLIADATGAAATIEYLGGELVVHAGASLPTANLTNDSYESSLRYLSQFSGFGGTRGMPSSTSSLDRFARTAIALRQPANNRTAVERTLDILASAAQPGSTRWSVAYDATHRALTWRTDATPALKTIAMDRVDFGCAAQRLAIDVRSTATGDVTDRLQVLTANENLARMMTSYATTNMIGQTSTAWIERAAAHADEFSCASGRRGRTVR
jgi:choloylglycine hydrolase